MVSNLVCEKDHVMYVSDLKYYIFKTASIRHRRTGSVSWSLSEML